MFYVILSKKVCPTTLSSHDPNFINKCVFFEKRLEGKTSIVWWEIGYIFKKEILLCVLVSVMTMSSF